jgi:hypothetical protein
MAHTLPQASDGAVETYSAVLQKLGLSVGNFAAASLELMTWKGCIVLIERLEQQLMRLG